MSNFLGGIEQDSEGSLASDSIDQWLDRFRPEIRPFSQREDKKMEFVSNHSENANVRLREPGPRCSGEQLATERAPRAPLEKFFLKGRIEMFLYLRRTYKESLENFIAGPRVRVSAIRENVPLNSKTTKNHLEFFIQEGLIKEEWAEECVGKRKRLTLFFRFINSPKARIIGELIDLLEKHQKLEKSPLNREERSKQVKGAFHILWQIIVQQQLTFTQIKQLVKMNHYYVLRYLDYLETQGLIIVESLECQESPILGAQDAKPEFRRFYHAIIRPNLKNEIVVGFSKALQNWAP